MDDLPAWALEVAAQGLGYETFSDVPLENYQELFIIAEGLEG